MLWLEINAAKPTEGTFETPEKITTLFNKLNNPSFGLCIDTAHLWSLGVSMTTHDEALHWLEKLPDVPTMIHLNDSRAVFGSGVDRHQTLTMGNIWHEDCTGLMVILDWAYKAGYMIILERHPEGLKSDLKTITRLIHI
jgi:endonuclease IV